MQAGGFTRTHEHGRKTQVPDLDLESDSPYRYLQGRMMPRYPAVFFDRDGTLIEDVGFLKDVSGIRLFPDTLEALHKLRKHFLFFVVTNQSGVSDGQIRMEDVEQVNGALDGIFQDNGIQFQEWYVCPHNKIDGCNCRKPNPRFLVEAAEMYGVDLKKSYIIGDHPHDAYTGKSLGVAGLYLLTGHGRKHLAELADDVPVFECLRDAADWIDQHARVSGRSEPRSLGSI